MGNQDSKGRESGIQSTTDSKQNEQTSHMLAVYMIETDNGRTEFNSDIFKKLFFSDHPELSDALFHHMVASEFQHDSSTTHEDYMKAIMTKDSFVTHSCELVNMKSPSTQLKFYFNLFSKQQRNLLHKDCECLVISCYKAALSMCACPPESADNVIRQTDVSASVKCMLCGDDSITEPRLSSWVQRHCPGMVDCLHQMVCQRLWDKNKHVKFTAMSVPELYTPMKEGKHLLSLFTSWLLSCQLAPGYIPNQGSLGTSVPLNSILNGGWHLLYDSNNQGLSINRFQHHVFQYSAPTVTMISFEGHCYCLAVNEEWREHTKCWGGSDCNLIQTSPEFKVVQSGSDLAFLNWSLKSLPKGIQIGGSECRTRVLEIEEDLLKVKHYGMSIPLYRIEVWGCGGDKIKDAQKKQKDWEKQDALRQKDRKLKIDVNDWKNSPDRQILEMGGVTTEHAER